MTPSTLSVAMHEIGHCVVQFVIAPRHWIQSVSLTGLPEGHLGYVETDTLWQSYMLSAKAPHDTVEQWRRLAWDDIVIFLAGPIAELKWCRCSKDGIIGAGLDLADACLNDPALERETDLGQVRARLQWANPGEEEETFLRLWNEAHRLTIENWRSIVTIGRELATRMHLSHADLAELWNARA